MKLPGNRRLIPSLSALVAFESAARLGSVRRAAEELDLTQGAVSRQIKMLEDRMGVTLFERIRQRIVITEVGSYYVGEIREVLGRLSGATAEAISYRTAGGILRLSMLPTFGTRWLLPRLPDFFRQHRSVTINFATHIRPVDFGRDFLDAAIHFGGPEWPGVTLHRLFGEKLIPVAAPALIARQKINEPGDIRRSTLLAQVTRPEAWPRWLKQAGVEDTGEQWNMLQFEQFAMVLQAAVAELGVALVPKILVTGELAGGQLVEVFDQPIIESKGYYLAYPRERAGFPPLIAFRDWLLEQVPPEEP